MQIRTRQAALVLALIAPIALTVLTAPPFVAEPTAQGGGGGMVGPLAPVRAGGATFYPTLASGSTYVLNSPWHCNPSDTSNRFTFGGGPPYTTVTRDNRGRGQTVNVTATTGGFPTGFSFTDTDGGNGTAELVDTNADGIHDTVIGRGTRGVSGAAVNFSLALQHIDNNSDGNPDHVSVPWAQVNALGWLAPADGCNDTEPQVWIPLADRNSDGKPDSIVFDLDGNGVADPQFSTSPPIVPAAVPSVNWPGLALLAVLLASLAVWSLARRQGVSPA